MGKRLVRDRALETWVAGAEAAKQVRPVHDEDEHLELLSHKFHEEAGEFLFAAMTGTTDEFLKEAADVISVMRSMARANGIPWADVMLTSQKRDEASGGFDNGMVWETSR